MELGDYTGIFDYKIDLHFYQYKLDKYVIRKY